MGQVEELKACEWCKGAVEFRRSHVQGEGGYIVHVEYSADCFVAHGNSLSEEDDEEMVRRWNTRAADTQAESLPALTRERDALAAAVQWREITQTDLPKVGDEVWSDTRNTIVVGVQDWILNMLGTDHRVWLQNHYTHFRPINAPTAALAPQPQDFAAKHSYLSTACFHGKHDECRQSCKFCSTPCNCPHHSAAPQPQEAP